MSDPGKFDPTRPGDDWILVGAWENDSPIPFWDCGWGPLWVALGESGVEGVVRARTFEEAYESAIDEIYPAPEDWMVEEYEAEVAKKLEEDGEYPDVPENWQARGSSPTQREEFPRIKGMYAYTGYDNRLVLLKKHMRDSKHPIRVLFKKWT